jgi:hypothetical protein
VSRNPETDLDHGGNLLDGGPPVIYYSALAYRVAGATGLVVACALLAYGIVQAQALNVAAGLAVVVVVGIFRHANRRKPRGGAVALAREGDLLVGGELPHPLPISETTFDVVPDYQGSWLVLLRSGDDTIRLAPGGWKLRSKAIVDQAAARQVLLALGLRERAR